METLVRIYNSLNPKRSGLIISLAILIGFFALFHGIIYQNTTEANIESSISLKDFPLAFGDWTGVDSTGLDIRSLDILRLSSYVTRTYTNKSGDSISLYIGYWSSQSGEYQAAKHSPALCLPSNGWQTLHLDDYIYENDTLNLTEPIKIRKIIGTKRDTTDLFYYWFFAGRNYYSQEWYALIKLSLAKLLYGRNDGGIVEVSTAIKKGLSKEEAQENSEKVIKSFISDLMPILHNKISSNP